MGMLQWLIVIIFLCVLLLNSPFRHKSYSPAQLRKLSIIAGSWLQLSLLIAPCFAEAISSNANYVSPPIDYDFDEYSTDNRLSLGKDREIIYVSVNVKWLFRSVFNRAFWRDHIHHAVTSVKGMDTMSKYKHNAIEIISDICRISNTCTLKCFKGSLEQAENLSRLLNKPILMYVENGDFYDPSMNAIAFRQALADSSLSNYINDNYIFFAGRLNHKELKSFLSGFKIDTYPAMLVIVPMYPMEGNEESYTQFQDSKFNLHVLRSYGVIDIIPNKILKFIQNELKGCQTKRHASS